MRSFFVLFLMLMLAIPSLSATSVTSPIYLIKLRAIEVSASNQQVLLAGLSSVTHVGATVPMSISRTWGDLVSYTCTLAAQEQCPLRNSKTVDEAVVSVTIENENENESVAPKPFKLNAEVSSVDINVALSDHYTKSGISHLRITPAGNSVSVVLGEPKVWATGVRDGKAVLYIGTIIKLPG